MRRFIPRLIRFTSVLSVIFGPTAAMAAATLPTPTPVSVVAPATEQPKRLNTLKVHGASEIDRRLAALHDAHEKLKVSTKLATADKTVIIVQLESETKALSHYKDQLSAETDLGYARRDVQLVINEYAPYMLALTRGRLMASTDRTMVAADQVQTLLDKSQKALELAQVQNKDTTELTGHISRLRDVMTEARLFYQSIPTKIITTKPTDYTTDYTALTVYASNLHSARTDLRVAREEIDSIITAISILKSATPSPSPSASGSPAALPSTTPLAPPAGP